MILAGCSNQSKRPDPVEYFNTQITDDGTKFFVYRLEKPHSDKRTNIGPENTPGQGRRGGGIKGDRKIQQGRSNQAGNKMTAKLENNLDALLAKNGYCRNGYFELERHQLHGGLSLRGECRDDATEDDRLRFISEQ